jgi:hypothetical protein
MLKRLWHWVRYSGQASGSDFLPDPFDDPRLWNEAEQLEDGSVDPDDVRDPVPWWDEGADDET